MPHESRPLRILVIAPTPFFADRGCHVRIYEQCRALKRAGHDVVICTYHVGRDVEDLEIRRSVRIPWYRRLSAGPSVHKFYIDGFLLATSLRQCLRQRPDIIHAHLHEGVAIGRIVRALSGAPLVADLQGSLVDELAQHGFVRPGRPLHRIFHEAERMIVRMPDAIIASSSGALSSIPVRSGTPASLMPDGVDTETFFPDRPGRSAIRERLGIGHDKPVVGYLGVLTEYQGVSILLNAAQRLMKCARPRPHILIMGYPDVERYRQQAASLGLSGHVTFTGRVPYDEARAYLSACDVAVSPKLSETEANGKLLNYMAVGLPIVASDTPINREILGNAGILTRRGDAGALAEAVLHILSDYRLARDLERRSLDRARSYSWATLTGRLTQLYHELIPSTPVHTPEPQAMQI